MDAGRWSQSRKMRRANENQRVNSVEYVNEFHDRRQPFTDTGYSTLSTYNIIWFDAQAGRRWLRRQFSLEEADRNPRARR